MTDSLVDAVLRREWSKSMSPFGTSEDRKTYFCNVRFQAAEMPAFAAGMGAKPT
jgi:hypothetical protein